MNRTNHGRRAAGFTLIEVMIVIAIVVALAGLVGVALFARRDDAKLGLARTELTTIKNGMKLFRLDFERWPSDTEGLEVLWNKERLDPEADQAKWKGYLEEPMPNDQWDQPWGYRAESDEDPTRYDLWSNGPDKEEGTEDDILSQPRSEDAEGGSGVDGPPPAGGR
jgi:general secretion pathway protein G